LAYLAYCNADTPEPLVGEWNYTNPLSQGLCMKLKAGIRLDIAYETIHHNGTRRTATIISDNRTVVDGKDCQCENATLDHNETMVLKFNKDRKLSLYFTKDPQITKDEKGIKWLLYRIAFDFVYDSTTFPASLESGNDSLSNTNKSLAGIGTATDRSFTCSKDSKVDVTDRLKITFTNLRVQPFIGKNDFSTADHCAADHETTDLIPIIIGAALAALVIIVLIAYLIGRARANNTPNYDNMK